MPVCCAILLFVGTFHFARISFIPIKFVHFFCFAVVGLDPFVFGFLLDFGFPDCVLP